MVKLNRIYTRTGDDGTTGLVDGSRLAKHAPRMEAIGAVDEANAALGLTARELEGELAESIRRIQNDLFDLGADLATPGDDFAPSETVLQIVPAQVAGLEERIDAATALLEPLRSFVLPGGSAASAQLHVARTLVRRAERAMTALAEGDKVNPAALAYINRLSDYLFVLARFANDAGRSDVLWKPGANRQERESPAVRSWTKGEFPMAHDKVESQEQRQAGLAPETHNDEQDDHRSQAQEVSEQAQQTTGATQSPTESSRDKNTKSLLDNSTQDTVDRMRDMESSGRVDMDAYAGEANHDDNVDKYGKDKKLDGLRGDGT